MFSIYATVKYKTIFKMNFSYFVQWIHNYTNCFKATPHLLATLDTLCFVVVFFLRPGNIACSRQLEARVLRFSRAVTIRVAGISG